MPSDARVEQMDSGGFECPGIGCGFLASHSAFDQIDGGNPEHDEKPLARGCAHGLDCLDWQPNAVFEGSAEFVLARVGQGGGELVEQVAFRAHDFNAVIASLAGHGRCLRHVVDGRPDLCSRECAGHETVDRCAHIRGADAQIMLGIASGVQDLQHDASTFGVHCVSDRAMQSQIGRPVEHGRIFFHAAFQVGGKAAREDQRGLAAGACAKEFGQPLVGPIQGFQPGVHGAHDHAVAQRHEAEVVGCEQVGKMRHFDWICVDSRCLRPGWCGLAGCLAWRALSPWC